MKTRAGAQGPNQSAGNEGGTSCEQSFSSALDLSGQNLFGGADSAVLLDTGDTVNLASLRWLARRIGILKEGVSPCCDLSGLCAN